ncbi:MAG: hypothetical protein U0586_16095 [Candidatus Brocadiaceae bacterium]
MNIYEQVKQALQDIVAPELKSIQVEIKRLDNRIDSVDKRIDSVKSEITSEINSLKTVLTTEIKRLDDKIDSLDDKIDIAIQIRERLAILEAKLASLEHS